MTAGVISTTKKNIEVDPHGLPQHAIGAKLDAGKLRPSLIISHMPRALTEVIRVGTEGANKYTEGGWLAVIGGEQRYLDAMDRHRLMESIEGMYDLDFAAEGKQIFHAAQIAWNALARLELMLRRLEKEKAGDSDAEDHF